MGRDKARTPVAGVPLAARVARALRKVAYPVLAVGGAAGTGLARVDDPRQGPLVAFAAGIEALAGDPPLHVQPVVLVACDLPFVEAHVLAELTAMLGDADAVVPVVGGEDQPLCAVYSPKACAEAVRLVRDEKRRAMRDLLRVVDVVRFEADAWGQMLLDVDTPEELESARRILEAPE